MATSPVNCSMCKYQDNLENEVWQPFPHGIAVLGQWQYYCGYTVLVARRHATELFDLDSTFRRGYLDDMCLLAQAIHEAFRPHKINYELLGNQVPHLHWHLFPRYATDPDARNPVWIALNRAEKDAELTRFLETAPQYRSTTIALLRQHLTLLGAPTA